MSRAWPLLLAVLLGGCSLFGDEDNTAPPARLESIDARVDFDRLWSHDTGKGTDGRLLKLVPAIDGDSLFVADHGGAVERLALADGKRLWRTRTGASISAGPGTGEGLVLVGSSDGELLALDREDGSERWRVAVSSEVLSVPRIAYDVVVVQTVDGNLAGYSASDGSRLWVFDRTVPVLTLRGTSTPLIIDNVVLAGFATGKLAALDITSGRQLWETTVTVPHGRSELDRIVDIDADPVLRDSILYVVSFQGQLAAIDLAKGRTLWKRDMSAYAGLAVDARQVYLTDDQSQVWALDRLSGASMWKQDKLLHRALTGPALIDDYLAVGDFDGYLHLLLRSSGDIVGRVRVDSEGIQVTPVVRDGHLYVLGAGGKLVAYALEARD